MVDMSQNKTLIAYATSGGTTEEYAKAKGMKSGKSKKTNKKTAQKMI